MKYFFVLLLFSLVLQAKFYAPLSQANILLKQDCLLITSTGLSRLQNFCHKYVLSVQSTVEMEQELENKKAISKKDSKAYLNTLRKDAQFRKHIVHQIEEDILRTQDDTLALKLFNLNSFEASIKSVKNIQSRNILFPQITQTKIEDFLYKYHLPKDGFARKRSSYKQTRVPSLAASNRVNYTSISKDYADPDTVRDYPQNYVNKGFTLECTATGLFIKQDKDLYSYKNVSGFSCKNNNGATSFLWNVYATGKVLNRFHGMTKKRMNFKAYARVKHIKDTYVVIIDKIKDSNRFNIHYLN